MKNGLKFGLGKYSSLQIGLRTDNAQIADIQFPPDEEEELPPNVVTWKGIPVTYKGEYVTYAGT